ncbi:hypothetical protein SAMN05421780_11365 [Flexibacter flexilis DSM 6793]|uniref:SMODS-associating 2TM beta-strand rich effector domain-containing protein n=1 Tax=Flexibacter flexilis DSM 6793 TaxID=927664 RepID=A0A1I1N9T9_9BACT|nr:hypothetical protein [Flexibacter flexilis]SFC94441.1 hypothetical protein SAMN05421780_11365 [Flexibacter flexilis DSM 6793]
MDKIISTEPNWIITTLIGTVIGYLYPYFIKGIIYIGRLLFTKHYLTGQWNSYYQIWENNLAVIKHEKWTVSLGYNSKLKVKIKTVAEGNLNYSGELTEERGHLIVTLKAKEYDERVFGRYPIPIPSNDATVVGLWLGVDFNAHATVGANILSRIELDNEKIIILLREYTEVDTENEMIRLKH